MSLNLTEPGSSYIPPVMRYVYLLAVLLLAPVAAHAQATLFTANPSARAALSPAQAEVLGHVEASPAFVSAELGRVQPEVLAEGSAVRLALPGGETVTLAAERVTERAADDRSWYGIGMDETTTGQFVVRGEVVVGTVRHDGQLYTLRPLGDGLHALALLDEHRFPPSHAAQVRPAAEREKTASRPQRAAPATPSPTMSSSSATIDVLVAYTGGARVSAGGTSAIQALAQLAVDEANVSYLNSNVAMQLALVHIYQTPTNEAAIDDDLDYFQSNGDGRFDEVHALRDQYGADAISLFGSYPICGDSYMGPPIPESYAVSVVYWNCAAGQYGLAHEIGHNLGAGHDPAGGYNHIYSYGYGYRSPAGWRTVMAEGTGSRIPHWSNPDVFYNGEPTGTTVPNQWGGTSENARVLNENAAIVAGYRDSVTGCQQSLSATLSNASPAPGQTITFAATVSNAAASAAPVDLWLDASGPVSRRIRFGSGTLPAGATATVNVPLRVPSNAPAGSYDLDLHLGDFDGDVACDTEEFVLTVAPARVAVTGDTEFTTTVQDDLFAAGVATAAPAAVRTAAPSVTVGPNPFRSRTTVRYQVEEPAEVRLAVYDLLGRTVAVLAEGRVEAGAHAATFDARGLAAGTYVWRLQAGDRVETGRLTVLY